MSGKNENTTGISRRNFLKSSGHLLIGFSILQLPFHVSGKTEDQSAEFSPGGPDEIDSWIRIDADGSATVLTGKMELGQGIKTALKQMAAEELDLDMSRVKIIIADTALTQNEGFTAGSGSIERSGYAIRRAAAEAKQQLLILAAEKLSLPIGRLEVNDGMVSSTENNQKISYWDLLKSRKLEGKISANPVLKDHVRFKLVGKPIQRDDITEMVTGKYIYVHDLRFPNMVHARVCHPPAYNSELISVPEDEIKSLPGVLKLVRNGRFLGVIAQEEYQAVKALELISAKAVWKNKPISPNQPELYNDIKNSLADGELVDKNDKVVTLIEESPVKHEATYYRPYQMHGSIGPSCAVAEWKEGQLRIWSHTQGVLPLRRTIADLLQMDEAKIRVTGVPGSGCYGHNAADDAAADAVLLAMEMPGKSVRVMWMRGDEHRWEPYGSAMVMKIGAGIDKSGLITAWNAEVWSDTHSTRAAGKAGHLIAGRHLEKPFAFAGDRFSGGSHRNSSPIYNVPSRQIKLFNYKGPLRTSSLRSLGSYANIFALESFMDELAFKARLDPVEFRLKHLSDERIIELIQTLAQKSGWKSFKKQKNRGIGFAFSQYKNQAAYFGAVAEVYIDHPAKKIRLSRLTGCIDAGQTINSDGLKNQTEGGMIQSASWTMMEEVKYDQNGIVSTNWNSYPIMRFMDSPQTEVFIIDRPEKNPLGAGEAAQGPVAAALANAVFNASGKRLREIPLLYEKLME